MNGDKMAFAKSGAVDPCGNQLSGEQTGMSLREYYAGQALAGLLANDTGPAGDWKKSAKDAMEAADALIAELEGGE